MVCIVSSSAAVCVSCCWGSLLGHRVCCVTERHHHILEPWSYYIWSVIKTKQHNIQYKPVTLILTLKPFTDWLPLESILSLSNLWTIRNKHMQLVCREYEGNQSLLPVFFCVIVTLSLYSVTMLSVSTNWKWTHFLCVIFISLCYLADCFLSFLM